MTPKFAIGEFVWIARFESTKTRITCPDCGGTKFMTIRLFDGSEHTVDCRTCEWGFEGPHGYLLVYDRKPTTCRTLITGMLLDGGAFKYNTDDGWHIAEDDLFADEDSAVARAVEIAARAEQDERDRILKKEKDTKSWAWNATYHRDCIRRAERDLKYHTAKLDVAHVKTREDKAAKQGTTR